MTTTTVIIMIIIGLIIIVASFFITEKMTGKEENYKLDLMTVDEDYEFSEREQKIIKRKIEDTIANQAKDILYQTNESLASMANEKTIALGDYAVAVCEEIEKNHKEVMFLYSMLEDKQKEIMKTVQAVDKTSAEVKQILSERIGVRVQEHDKEQKKTLPQPKEETKKPSAIDQLTALKKQKAQMNEQIEEKTHIKKKEEVIYPESPAQQKSVDSSQLKDEDTTLIDDFADNLISDEEIDMVFEELEQEAISLDEDLEEEYVENENSNDIILDMYRNGESILNIAKQLGLGVGEVKLVIDLYQGE